MPKSERKKKMKLWLSGRSNKVTSSSGVLDRQTMQPLPENQSGKYFQEIDKLPLSRFIDCVIDRTLTSLVIEGNPPTEELEAAFNDIYQQYTDIMGDAEYKHYLTTWKELIKVDCTIKQIDELITALKLFPCVPFYDELNRLLKTDFKFNYANRDEYFKLLDRAHNRSRGIVIQRDLLQLKFDAIVAKMKGSGDKAITRKYFIDWLILLSDHVQTTITDQITVYEFCERIRQYNRYVEREKAKK